MSKPIISIKNLSKKYLIGERRASYATLTESVSSYFKNKLNFSKKNAEDTFYALNNISLDVHEGEVVGIIGRNGAGKSTLLKILSRITYPTTGRARLFGRVGSLLEVGVGFHPELTGRENIFLNGAILGMAKVEIRKKMDEIINFSEIEKFLDTPVKFYSSGMYVRLAFAVAAHLETEILIVDEVLAVGDYAFQTKCLGKMDSISKSGKTVIFVSHNMASIKSLCSRTILLKNGEIILDSPANDGVDFYLNENLSKKARITSSHFQDFIEGKIRKNDPMVTIQEISILDKSDKPRNVFYSDEEIKIQVIYKCYKQMKGLNILVQIVDDNNNPIVISNNLDDSNELKDIYNKEEGLYKSECIFLPNFFGEKRFYVSFQVIFPKIEHLNLNKAFYFDVKFKGYNNLTHVKNCYIRPNLSWTTKVLNDIR